MNIWGTVLLVLGILFLIMFVFAEFGGGHIGFVPFFVSAFLIFMGWNLRKSGEGNFAIKTRGGTSRCADFGCARTVSRAYTGILDSGDAADAGNRGNDQATKWREQNDFYSMLLSDVWYFSAVSALCLA